MKNRTLARSLLVILGVILLAPVFGQNATALRLLRPALKGAELGVGLRCANPTYRKQDRRPSVTSVVPPIDESGRDPELSAYVKQLRNAVQERNANLLKNLMASDILLTLGPPPEESPEEILALTNPNSPIWKELDTMLTLGGAFQGRRRYCIPYVYAAFPHDLDPYAHQVIIKPSVSARIEPDRDAAKVATLDFAIVQTDPGTPMIITGTEGERWVRIYLNNQAAYVLENALRSPIDHRACFERREAGWVMTHLVSGD